ncbi:transporter substrate-binding domain-containing protein [Marinobacterium lutimaris]|uniref:Amino acid ABC transporter substrate-binding protein, PAAT family n=1 Tax=Marinobacterium lutimaris TaxID=568106 RepID=A0A1H6D8A1_9GAMM|nr:transporter substrate-binding domain-containing protein [Marinobacterium lutimaris]SEG80955.1 amino acid ABC transporter substrate-binding protein, PAAT family [Marinobacterium lutimaris]
MTSMLSVLKKTTPIVMLAGAISCSTLTAASTVDEIKAKGTITVATEDNYRPFEFVQDGVSTGYDNELKALVEKESGIKLEQEIMPWAGILPGVQSGKFDMALSAVMVTDQRRKVFDFTTPTAASQTYFATKADSDIKSGKDLIGKTVGAETGSAFLLELKAYDKKLKDEHGEGVGKIVEYHGYPEAYQDLALGRLDAVVNTDITLRSLMEERPGVFSLGEPVGEPGYKAWAVKKGNEAVLKVVNDAMLKVRESGEMYRLQEKWLGAKNEDMPLDVN